MASTEKAQKSKIQDIEDSGFKGYSEANGGGTPVGGQYGGPSGRVGWKERGEPGHRESQPRTKDGRFTYNSVNGKELSPTSDPDRGKTVNPLLTGGENGVLIKDVEEQFEKGEGNIWDKYKHKWYQKGGEYVLSDLKTHVSGKAIWQVARGSYDSVKGEFQGESQVFDKVKVGKKSAEEKLAKQQVEAAGGGEQAVIEKTGGGIKIAPHSVQVKTYVKPKTEKKVPDKSYIAPSMPVGGEKPEKSVESSTSPSTSGAESASNKIEVKNIANEPFGSGKYTMGEAEAIKDYIKSEMGEDFDEDMWDDKTLEEFIDSNGGKELFVSPAPSEPEAKEEEESETIKKIKDMGFSA